MKDYIISVVSYKRPNNNTCKLLLETNFNWNVYVYSFDPFIEEYRTLYQGHIREITEISTPNLAKKRQLVLDDALGEYKYCIMLDDDIEKIVNSDENEITFSTALSTMMRLILLNSSYVALSFAYNKTDTKKEITKYKNICNNSIFNMDVYKNYLVRYNENSKCEDMEFTIDLISKGAITGRIETIIIKNTLQGGLTNDGLSYRFKDTNRFIEEGKYMQSRYPNCKDAFEYDETHFKLNTNKLLRGLKNEN